MPALIVLICFLFLSCKAQIEYLGAARPSHHRPVDVYVTDQAIKKQYTIIGKGYLRNWNQIHGIEKIQKLAEKKAAQKGADGVILWEQNMSGDPLLTQPERWSTEEVGAAPNWSTHQAIFRVVSFHIYFIKYDN
ncbi:MAG: hypothetical protein N2747_09590 [Chitinophagaceae bacterium]|nr:hypothetical protein [Chitinophagaceae bacterium]